MIKILPFSFKNRIAFNYLISGSILIAFVFVSIFLIVKYSVNKHINSEINAELQKHLNDVSIDEHETYLIQVDQWRAREFNTVSFNPVFVQYFDLNKELIDKSPNLKNSDLKLFTNSQNNQFINSQLNGNSVRQIQTPIINKNRIVGYVVVAMSLEDFEIVGILKNILLVSYPFILLVLFFIARFFAGKSIQPISTIIETSNSITKDNLKTRIQLPQNKDEIYTLAQNINNLLDRIEKAIAREKQFTSDASHELRTPLAVVKGTLEVLVRKPRTNEEYNEKINYCITEVDRINNLVDQLLLLARFENQKQNSKKESVFLNALLLDILALHSNSIKEKEIQISTNFAEDFYLDSDYNLVSMIFSNLISNAVKYSNQNGKISIELANNLNNEITCKIKDKGIGISKEDLETIFDSFYRSNATNHPQIKGTGIGLSIVKRICEMLNISLKIKSKIKKGTTLILTFSK